MEDKANLYVFHKKEVVLIFVFMLLISIISFVLGVKVGNKFSYLDAGYTQEDKQVVDMLSDKEEMVDQLGDGVEKPKDEEVERFQEKMDENLEKKIIKELEGEDSKFNGGAQNSAASEDEMIPDSKPLFNDADITSAPPKTKRDNYSGKYTIQLGSYRTINEAEEFANGFKIKGYNPIVNEVAIKNRGVWYRVSLGVFDSLADAKDYVVKERELFMGQDYVFGQFD